jgi:hypothetical protein
MLELSECFGGWVWLDVFEPVFFVVCLSGGCFMGWVGYKVQNRVGWVGVWFFFRFCVHHHHHT